MREGMLPEVSDKKDWIHRCHLMSNQGLLLQPAVNAIECSQKKLSSRQAGARGGTLI